MYVSWHLISSSADLFVCCCLSVLCCPHRDISKLALFNVLGVGAVVLLGAAAGLLGVVAVVNGTAFAPPAGECGCCWVHGPVLAWLADLRLASMDSHEPQPWLLLLLLLMLVPPVPAAPNLAAFGSTDLKVLMGLAGVVPIILNCYVGHQSVHGIMGMLKPYTPSEGTQWAILPFSTRS